MLQQGALAPPSLMQWVAMQDSPQAPIPQMVALPQVAVVHPSCPMREPLKLNLKLSAAQPSFATSDPYRKLLILPGARPSLIAVQAERMHRCLRSSPSSLRAPDCCCVRLLALLPHRQARQQPRTVRCGIHRPVKSDEARRAAPAVHPRTCRWCCDRSVHSRCLKSALRNGAMICAAKDRAGTSPRLRRDRSEHRAGQAPAKAVNRSQADRRCGWKALMARG